MRSYTRYSFPLTSVRNFVTSAQVSNNQPPTLCFSDVVEFKAPSKIRGMLSFVLGVLCFNISSSILGGAACEEKVRVGLLE